MKNNKIFWISYSDLMTSMFFIMLVLFVLSIGYLYEQNKEVYKKNIENEKLIKELDKEKKRQEVEINKLKQIIKIEKQFKPLEQDKSFLYLPDCKKFVIKDFMEQEIFDPYQTTIKHKYVPLTIEIGRKIEKFLDTLNKQNPELSYLLVIEGNTANHVEKNWNKDDRTAYLRSFKRALAVYLLWRKHGIDFRKYNAEILISGSGFNGICRDTVERNNKRFSIQIIPKVEKINSNKSVVNSE